MYCSPGVSEVVKFLQLNQSNRFDERLPRLFHYPHENIHRIKYNLKNVGSV